TNTARSELGGRQVVVGPEGAEPVQFTRKIFIPTDDTFARYLEIIQNNSTAPLDLPVLILTNVGSDNSTEVVDRPATPVVPLVGDYAITDDEDGRGAPAVTLVAYGAGAVAAPPSITITADQPDVIAVTYQVHVPPLSHVALLHFLVQSTTRAAAQERTQTLLHLGGQALAGLTDDERNAIVNFPAAQDSDHDGLSDIDEATHGTGVDQPDSDGDGLLDGFEVRYGLNPLDPSDANGDTDGDGLNNLDEQSAGTNPLVADSDADGLSDGAEVHTYSTDPLRPDTDGGGESDGAEVNGVSPTNPLDPLDDRPGMVPLPITLYDGEGFRWDIQAYGNIGTGSDGAFDFGFESLVGGGASFHMNPAAVAPGGREITVANEMSSESALQYQRRIYVPRDAAFIRYLEIFDNPGPTAQSTTLDVTSDLGSDIQTNIVLTSSGDQQLEDGDQFAITDDIDAEGDPTLLFLLGDATAPSPAHVVFYSPLMPDLLWIRYQITVPANGRAIVMHVGAQQHDQAEARVTLAELLTLPESLLTGIGDADRLAVVNFVLPISEATPAPTSTTPTHLRSLPTPTASPTSIAPEIVQ
ncbi:MAG TPA: hypothetical protein VMT89_05660, partial [Candidatus Acidoferrales bacterium]|nr:hypothetical protein [Candidatus Acidoferrales bacterium]